MSGRFNENTRVQVPAAIHLCRLGYTYLDRIDAAEYEPSTNILVGVFREAMSRLNPEMSDAEISLQLSSLVQAAKNDDLGREFYRKTTSVSGVRFIDFDNPNNNLWHCTTKFTCENPDTHDSFRPDITCFVNGLPLAFIEVKKPNNHEGMLAERERLNTRFRNKAFRPFLNITQLMIFSNNQEYDSENVVPVQGAFYATTGTNVSVLFFDNSRKADKVVLIDASKLGEEYKDGNNQRKRLRDFEIQKIVDTFLNQKAEDGFSVVVSHDEIKAKGYTLSAGQYFDVKIEYVPITADEFAEKIAGFKSRLAELNAKGAELDSTIATTLDSLKLNEHVAGDKESEG